MKAFIENIVFKYQKEAICIGVFLENRTEWKLSAVHARIHNNEIAIIAGKGQFKDLNEISEMLNKDIPILLHLDGWGVLIKENGAENNSIPADNHEFYIRKYLNPEGKENYFSIIRTELMKSIIDYFNTASLKISGIYIGPFSTGILSSFFEEGEEIKTGKWKCTLRNGCINTFVSEGVENGKIYEIGGDRISAGLLPLYASIVEFFLGDRGDNDLVKGIREEFIYGKLTKYLGVCSLTLILILLLVNYFVWDRLRNKNSELTFEVKRNEEIISELANKEKEVKEKENLVFLYVGSDGKSDFSWYSDKLVLKLPKGIRLTLMTIQPLNKKQKPGIAIEYINRLIEIEGDARNMSDITTWVNLITTERWVKKVELVSFISDKDNNLGHFKLLLKY